jgi:hypothetical protein
MFDKVQKASTSSSDWSPAQLQKQDNFSPQPQQEKSSSFSMSTKGEDTWSLDDDPLFRRWNKEEADGETQPIAMANAVAQKEDTKSSSETKAGLEQSLIEQQTDGVETNRDLQKSQSKSVKSKKSSLSSQERFALADVIQQLLGFFKPIGEFVAGAVYQWLYQNGEPARWLLQTLIPGWNGLERDVEQGLPKSWTFEAGRSLGDGLALVTGILEIVGGGGAAAGGGTLCVTGIGCIAGAPAVAGGVALGLHGSATSASALTSIAARLGVVFHSSAEGNSESDRAERSSIRGSGVPIPQRIQEYYRRLREAPNARSAEEGLQQVRDILNKVEDDLSGIPMKNPPPPPKMPDGRMYPPLDDFTTRHPNGSITAESRGHKIKIGADGSITITSKKSEQVEFSKPGAGQ